MKKLLRLFVVLMMVMILPKGVNGSTTSTSNWSDDDLKLSCTPLMKASTENRTYSYTKCDLMVTAPTLTNGATISFEASYNEIPVTFELIGELNGIAKNESESSEEWKYNVDFELPDNLIGRIRVATFYVEHCLSTEDDYAGINLNLIYTNGEETYTKNDPFEFAANWISYDWIFFGEKTYKEFYVENDYVNFLLDSEYIETTYILDNASDIRQNNSALLALSGTIDLNSIPDELEIYSLSVEEENYNYGVELNKNNGQFVIDFDDSQEGIEYQKENPIRIKLLYKVKDENKLLNFDGDGFSINIKDIKYLSDANKLEEIELENISVTDYISTIPGDWNGNNRFNLVDLVAYRMYLAGNDMSDYYDGKLTDNLKNIVDLNKDKEINLLDLIAARKSLVGLPIE